MDTDDFLTIEVLKHLREADVPLVVSRAGEVVWHDRELHAAAWAQAPVRYALLAVLEAVAPWQRARILLQCLQSSRQGINADTRRTLDRVVAVLLAILPADHVLTVFLALRRERANHKHTMRAIVRYLLNHPQLQDLVLRRRPTVADCLEHALGKNTARACVKMLTQADADAGYLRRHLLRYARDPDRVRAALPQLYARLEPPAEPAPLYTRAHQSYPASLCSRPEQPTTITADNRGDIASALVSWYRGGSERTALQDVEQHVARAARQLPRFGGRLALVLDASASMRGYGDREYCCLAQSAALQRVLESCCLRVTVNTVGGSGWPPAPMGATDLASGLLEALENEPDLVAIMSDGYENVMAGDLARVVATLPQIGIRIPIVFCNSKFTHSDDLTLRRPAQNLPELAFWHQDDFETLLISLCALAPREVGMPGLDEFLRNRLVQVEKELELWT